MLLAEHLTTFCDEQLSCACQTFNSVNYLLSLFITTAKTLVLCPPLHKCWTWIEVFSCASTYILKLHGFAIFCTCTNCCVHVELLPC